MSPQDAVVGGFLGCSGVKKLSAMKVDVGSIPGLGGHGNPLQYSCQENALDRGAWWTRVYGVAKSQKRLKWLSMAQNGEADGSPLLESSFCTSLSWDCLMTLGLMLQGGMRLEPLLRTPSAEAGSRAAYTVLGKPPGGGMDRILVYHGHLTLKIITKE